MDISRLLRKPNQAEQKWLVVVEDKNTQETTISLFDSENEAKEYAGFEVKNARDSGIGSQHYKVTVTHIEYFNA